MEAIAPDGAAAPLKADSVQAERVIFSRPDTVRLEQFEVPAPTSQQLLIEAEYSAISFGTEGELLRSSFLGYPVVPGYSLVGRVVKLGSRVKGFQLGERVCTSGSHASHFLADSDFTLRVPPEVDPQAASLFNLAHVALYGVRRARLELGHSALVLGQGLLGLITARLCALSGAAPVITAEISDHRRALSRAFSADQALDPSSSDWTRALSALPAGGPNVVFEATGTREALKMAIDTVCEQGRIILLSTASGQHRVDVHDQLAFKGIELIGAYVNSKPWSLSRMGVSIASWPPSLDRSSPPYFGAGSWTSQRDIETVFELMRLGRLRLETLISHRFAPREAAAAYSMVQKRDPSLVGGVFCWS